MKHDITGYGMFSHMHLRGEDMTFRRVVSGWPRGNAARDSQLQLQLAAGLSLGRR